MHRPDHPAPPPDAYLRTLLLALLAGGLLTALKLPLGWMLGAMLATAWLGWRDAAAVPEVVRPAGLVVLGLGLGQTFTAPVAAAVAASLPAILAGGMLSLVAGLAVAPLYRRIAGTDARTAYYAAIPGGIVTMAVLAQRAGAAVPAVTMAQTIRMAVVVLTFPPLVAVFAAGGRDAGFSAALPPFAWGGATLLLVGGTLVALAGARAGLANAAMLAPCLLAMGLSGQGLLPSSIPRWMVDAAQVAMGASLGLRLTPQALGAGPRRLALAGLVSALAVALLLAALGLALGRFAGLPPVAVVLGLAPGGMPEMAVTAKALELAVPLVLGFHLVRTVLCNLLVGPLWRAAVALRVAR
ncbi:AbrB family transcriptional regulator [Neoroseomonas soli]|uniref:AbrB family transcriptional regulator n=1 Tax=Neoroseomonas soli TaxID=1081025 RepID=A0A9X9X0N3_9PROT|nr:AbrB family transcriptional regulator [Neoroseomonas soli]